MPAEAPTQPDVQAIDVAREFVATKLALTQVVWNITGTTATLREPEESALMAWAGESAGVDLGDDRAPVWERADEITAQIMRAVGAYFIRVA